MIKVALCISGHVRNISNCYENIKYFVLDHYKPDVFISTWNTVGYWSTQERGFDDFTSIDENEIIKLYNPKVLDVEDYDNYENNFITRSKQFKNKLEYPQVRPTNIISMWYKIHKCNQLKSDYEIKNNFTYDLVIRCRFDLMHDRLFPIDLNGHVLIYHNTNNPKLFGDCFFMANSDDMNKICELYNNLEKLDCVFGPHIIFKTWILDNFKKIMFFVSDAKLWNTPKGYCIS